MAYSQSLFLVLAALVCGSNAVNFNWVGGNTNFSNPSNWAQGFGPFSQGVCQTHFGSDDTMVVSRLAPGNFRVGGLRLKNFGKLVLNGLGTRLTFSNAVPVDQSCTAEWIGGSQIDQTNNLMCHRNYVQVSGTQTSPAGNIPTELDTIVFDQYTRYQLRLDPGVSRVNIFKIRTQGRDLVQASDLSLLNSDWALIDKSKLYIGSDASDCSITRVDGKCLAVSSCPTPDQTAEYLRQLDLLAVQNATNTIDNLKQTVTKTFSGEITAAALNLTASQLQNALSGNTTALQKTIENQLKNLWGASNVTITTFAATPNGLAIAINGSVTSSVASLPNTPSGVIDISLLTWSQTDGNNLLALLQAVLSQGLSQSTSTNAIDQAIADMTAAGVNPNLINLFKELVQTFKNPLDAYNAVSSLVTNPCDAACVNNVFTTWQNANLGTRLGVTQANVQATANVFGNTCSSTSCASSDLTNALNTIQQANVANTPAAQPQQVAVLSPWLSFASSVATGRKVFWLDRTNAANFTQWMFDPVLKTMRIILPLGMRANDIKFRIVSDTTSSRRRRSTVYDTQLQLNYTTTCIPGSLACEISPTSDAAVNAVSQVTNLAIVFATVAPPYFLLASSTYDWPALTVAANTYCSNYGATNGRTAALNATHFWALSYVECGSLPRLANGTCLLYDPTADATVSTNLADLPCVPGATVAPTNAPSGTTTAATVPGTVGASTSSSSSSNTMVFAAAAGGGVVVIIIIVLVVLLMRKRKRNVKPNKADDRTVVAFENPMYDDNTKTAPVYDSHGGIGGGEGLYDEPAFQQSAKQNPLYSSHENLGDPVYDNEGNAGNAIYDNNGSAAYQDVAAGGENYLETNESGGGGASGYLDVAPDTEVEKEAVDTGYLDQ